MVCAEAPYPANTGAVCPALLTFELNTGEQHSPVYASTSLRQSN